MAGGGTTLEYTPTWIVALVCTVIVVVSLVAERLIHYAGKVLKRKNQKSLFEALQKIKEELMLLGFISLLLAVCQTCIVKICVNETLVTRWLPCNINDLRKAYHFRILAEADGSDICSNKGKVPLLSITAIHHLHIFIFVLAVSHVIFCVLTMGFGGLKIRSWKRWEDSISKTASEEGHKFTHVGDHAFIRQRYKGIGQNVFCLYVVPAFFKQFFASVTKTDYITLRLGFIMTHCQGNPKFNFNKYMIRALEADFKKVVGISWYLWLFVVVFLSLNVYGWHSYFWISFIPLILLLSVGTKLEHIISQLAREVADKHSAIEGELVVRPSDDHFWFRRPRLVLLLIHMILFQNSFEISFFFMILLQYGFDSCIMGKVRFIIPRLVIGVFVQVMCSYSTLPLYAIVTQMGSSFKKAIFKEHIHEGLAGWANQAKLKKKGLNNPANNDAGDDALASASDSAPATPTPLVGGQSVNSGPYEIVAHK